MPPPQGGHMKQYRCGMGLSLLYAGLNGKIHVFMLALPLHWAPRNGLNARECCFIVEVCLSQTIHCKVVSVCCQGDPMIDTEALQPELLWGQPEFIFVPKKIFLAD